MYGVKLMDRSTMDLMNMLGVEESIDMMAKASSMRWYVWYVSRKEKAYYKGLKV